MTTPKSKQTTPKSKRAIDGCRSTEPAKRTFQLRSALVGAVIGVLVYLVAVGAAQKIIGTYAKIRWAFSVIDQLDPDIYRDLLPPPGPDRGEKGGTLAEWVRRNLPAAGAKDYAAVGAIFLDTAERLRSGELEGKAQAYADTARELARVVDRATWTPFLTALVKRAESEPGELADLFETVGSAIRGEARSLREGGAA